MTPLDAALVAIAGAATIVACAAVGFAALLFNLASTLDDELEAMRSANEALLFPDRPGGRWSGSFQETPPG